MALHDYLINEGGASLQPKGDPQGHGGASRPHRVAYGAGLAERRRVRSAGSRSGLTVKVTGYSCWPDPGHCRADLP